MIASSVSSSENSVEFNPYPWLQSGVQCMLIKCMHILWSHSTDNICFQLYWLNVGRGWDKQIASTCNNSKRYVFLILIVCDCFEDFCSILIVFNAIIEVTERHIRHIFISTTESMKKMNAVYENLAIKVSQSQQCFQKFLARDQHIEYYPGSGRSIEHYEEVLQNPVERNSVVNLGELVENVWGGRSTTDRHRHPIKRLSKFNPRIPHKLSESNCKQRVKICSSLLSRTTNETGFERNVPGEEKQTIYKYVKRWRQWTRPGEEVAFKAKNGLPLCKVLLSGWWFRKAT